MKKSIILLLVFLFTNRINSFAQAPSSLPISFDWAQSAGGNEWDNNFKTITDSIGNVYTLGFTYSQIFNYTTDNSVNDDISSNTGSSVYLIKYSPTGDLIWKRMYNANASDERLDLTLKNDVLIWSAGFSGTKTFGDSTYTSANAGEGYSVLFASLDLDGNFNWANQLAVDSAEYSSIDLVVDNSGNVYFTTAFKGTVSTISGEYTSSGVGNDVLFGKINNNGNFAWVSKIGNDEDDKSGNIILDNNGDLLMTGRFTSTLTIGSINLISPVGYDWFLGKFNPDSGIPSWVISEGGLGSDDRISAIAVNPWNEIIITGRFANSFTFGNQNISSVGNDDIFVAKYSTTGDFNWVKTFGTTGENDWTSNVGIDDAGTIWMESSVGGDNNEQNYPVFYGSDNDSLNLSGNQDFVFCRYSNSGELLSINSYGTDSYEFTQDYFFDKQTGKSYISGHHTADTTLFNEDTLIVRGGFADGFTAVINPNVFAKNDHYNVSNTTQQNIMVLTNDVYPSSPNISIISGPLHGNALVMEENHIAYTANGDYNGNDTIRYRICEGHECDEALLIVTHNFTTSITEQVEAEVDMLLFPNPSSQVINLTSKKLRLYNIRVVNNLGQEIMSLESSEFSKTVDISNLSPGFYNIIVTDKDLKSRKSIKFVKQ